MTGASLKYLTKEGFRNVWTNRMMSAASIAVLMSCLVLIGTAAMVFFNIDALLEKIEEANVVMVFIDKEAEQSDVDEMGLSLKNMDNIQNIEFVSKETAWVEQLATMDKAHADFFAQVSDDIPLPDAYKVTVDNLDQFKQTVDKINTLDHVETVRQNRELAQKLVAIRQGISVIAIAIIIVLLAISLFIISNTIRLTVYSRRLEISIMKSVGATNGFVRFPFVIEGIILGVLSGVISLGLVWGVYNLAVSKFGELLSSLSLNPVAFTDYVVPMLCSFIIIGIFCGVGGSLTTMRKYLNKEGSEISDV